MRSRKIRLQNILCAPQNAVGQITRYHLSSKGPFNRQVHEPSRPQQLAEVKTHATEETNLVGCDGICFPVCFGARAGLNILHTAARQGGL